MWVLLLLLLKSVVLIEPAWHILCLCLPSTVRLKASKSKEMHCTARNPTLRRSTATPRPSVSEAASDNDVLGLSGIRSTTDFNQNQSLTCMLYYALCYTLLYMPVFIGTSPLMGPGCCPGLCKFPCEAACAMGFFSSSFVPKMPAPKMPVIMATEQPPSWCSPASERPWRIPSRLCGWMNVSWRLVFSRLARRTAVVVRSSLPVNAEACWTFHIWMAFYQVEDEPVG